MSWPGAGLVTQVLASHGRVDALVNNAAVFLYGLLEDIDSTAFDCLMRINVYGTQFGMKAVMPAMKAARSGAIVNISSVDGIRGTSGFSTYAVGKRAVRGMTKSVAMEAAPFGVRANTVHPGAIDTPMQNPQGLSPEENARSMPWIGLNRIGRPEEVARATMFLCSDDASYITGAELLVDGGWFAGGYLLDKPEPGKPNTEPFEPKS